MATPFKNAFIAIRNLGERFMRNDPVIKIAQINCACVLLLWLINVICVLSGHPGLTTVILQWTVEVPSAPELIVTRPWTLLTYMFAQYGIWHAIFNILCFLWFAKAAMNVIGYRRIWSLYISGGLGGAVFFISSCQLFGTDLAATQWLIGSSAAVLSVITAVVILCPEDTTEIFVLGEVRLRWVALVIIAICLAGGFTDDTYVATPAHVGGVVIGSVYALCFRRGILSRLSMLRYGRRINQINQEEVFRDNRKTASLSDMRHLDDILDKIRRSGFASLTSEERKRLFEVSNRIK